MLNLLEDYKLPILVNGKEYANGKIACAAFSKWEGDVEIELNWVKEPVQPEVPEQKERFEVPAQEYLITVRQYMTKPSTPAFDFHDKWNNGKPMPLRTMAGVILEETKGMVKMKLHGKPMPTKICVRCGRTLTHPVSLFYGIGPECGGHFHIGPEMDIEEIRKRMTDIEWTGWVIKSAITSKEEIIEGVAI